MNPLLLFALVSTFIGCHAQEQEDCPIGYLMNEVPIVREGLNGPINVDFSPDVKISRKGKFKVRGVVHVVITFPPDEAFFAGPICFDYRNMLKIGYGITKPPKACIFEEGKKCVRQTGAAETVSFVKTWQNTCLFETKKNPVPQYQSLQLSFFSAQRPVAQVNGMVARICVRKTEPVDDSDN